MKLKSLIPYISAVLIFFFIGLLYVIQPVSEGKKVHMGDISKHKGQVSELAKYKKETGKTALWTNSLFSGMPTYLISTPQAPAFTRFLHKILNLNYFFPVSFFFLYMLGFFIALQCFGVNPWLSIVGAIAYGFSSYFFILIPAGHMAKAIALGYMPPIIGGVYLAFKGKPLLGSVIFAIFFTLQMLINHLQMTYYTFIIIFIYGVIELVYRIKSGELQSLVKPIGLILLFAIIAIGCNFKVLLTTYEYGHYSIRGKSELTANKENQTSGLDKDYATQWSYGISESFTLLIPNFKGGASVGELPQDSETFKLLSQIQGKNQAKKTIKQMPLYWGKQPITSGPVYVGAMVCFLFVLGLFIVDKKLKWWLLITTIISLIFAWGKNIPGITNFLLDYLPGYNKFRSVSSALVIAQFTMPLLAVMAIVKVLNGEYKLPKLKKDLLYSFSIVGGLSLLFTLFGKNMFDFEAPTDQQYLAQGATQIVDAWQTDRAMLLRKDAFRSFVFIALAAALLYSYLIKKIKLNYFIAALGILLLADMWPIDKRYLSNDDFETPKENDIPYTASKADEMILKDPDPHYRVLNMSVSPFQDASTSYFHKSLGGYHGAKMRRYQELYEQVVVNEMQGLIVALKSGIQSSANRALETSYVLNMLNTKYFIVNPNGQPLLNTAALGNAWFTPGYKIVENADEEIATLKTINTKNQAIIDKRFEHILNGKVFMHDSLANISLIEYAPDYLKYTSNSNSEQLALFSEMYYPKGWVAKIDGKEVNHFRANYVLRAMVVPAGNHTIEFSFEPQSYKIGHAVALISSWVLFISMILTLGFYFKNLKQSKAKE